ncbi:hypothetical protein XBKB1_1080010 [Xenorhabdus bovienii str. kraussei Becker Underwood]|uniref:Uncharacterized protein n=1 Tax=Xenorhabdus bovienii str. kraussei Becker Underwood TaxID=1398204 RepID=A0A077PP41_XENBV|nr:hypothetical protein XBKB1_1080010 [Xenorhabdus bovienii str. kraussei Becker Underwood]
MLDIHKSNKVDRELKEINPVVILILVNLHVVISCFSIITLFNSYSSNLINAIKIIKQESVMKKSMINLITIFSTLVL